MTQINSHPDFRRNYLVFENVFFLLSQISVNEKKNSIRYRLSQFYDRNKKTTLHRIYRFPEFKIYNIRFLH